MIKIKAYTKNDHFPVSISDFIYSNGGRKESAQAFRAAVEGARFDAKSIAAALNSQNGILCRITPAGQTENTVILEATDYMGNTDEIKITKD